jgi:hypothetical protein
MPAESTAEVENLGSGGKTCNIAHKLNGLMGLLFSSMLIELCIPW